MAVESTRSFIAITFLAAAMLGTPTLLHGQSEWDVTKPRGRTRPLEFTTEEGTWMSVDVSPDGRWVAFDLLGHIYRVGIEGGKAECITQDSGIAINSQPRYSPDGQTIAFVSDRSGQLNLWTMEANGSDPRLLLADSDHRMDEPEWTADGSDVIVKVQNMNGGRRHRLRTRLWRVHVETGKSVELVGGAVRGAAFPSVSRDGKYLYFQAFTGIPRAVDLVQGDYQIRRLHLVSGGIEEMTSGRGDPGAGSYRLSNGGAIAPQISPDGRWLAFARRIPDGKISYKGHHYGPRTSLWLRDLKTGSEQILMDPIETDQSGWDLWYAVSLLPRYRWMPDAKSILIAQGGKIRRVHVQNGTVDTIPFIAKVRRTLSERAYTPIQLSDDVFPVRYLQNPTASPNGKTLVFQGVGKVWQKSLPNGEPKRLTSEAFTPFEFMPCWSPDGDWIVFASWDEKNRGHLWKVSAKGEVPKRLTTEPGEYFHPVWSPDGNEILVLRGSGATARGRPVRGNVWYELVRVPATGGPGTFVARVNRPIFDGVRPPGGGTVRPPIIQSSFGSNGRIFYPQQTSEREGTVTELLSVEADGSNKKVHLTFRDAAQIALSPDGQWVAFQQGENIYLLPFVGASAKPIDKGSAEVRRLSFHGGVFPRWKNRKTLEFGYGQRYFSYDVTEGSMDTVTIDLRVPRGIPQGTIAFKNARIITLEEPSVIHRGDVVIEGPRIGCVGKCDTSTAQRVIDISGKTIIPGLIDVHAHHHTQHEGLIPPHNFETAVYLAHGVTTTRNPGGSSQQIFPTSELTAAGLVIGPRTFSTGDAIGAGNGPGPNPITSYRVAMQEVRRRTSAGAVAIKQYLQPRREQRQWVVDAARETGVTVTAEGADLEYNLSMVMDGHTGFEHGMSCIPVYGDVAKFLGKAGFVYSPAFSVAGPGYVFNQDYFFQEQDLWKNEKLRRFLPWWQLMPHLRRRMLRPVTDYDFPMRAQGMADVISQGGYGAIGSHGQQHGLSSHWEVWMVASALGPLGALEVASLHGAHFIGVDEDLGSLAPGKLADLVILNSNPLENIRNTLDIQYVMKGGILYDADTLDELWPEKRPFGRYYWVNQEMLRDDVRPVDYWDRR